MNQQRLGYAADFVARVQNTPAASIVPRRHCEKPSIDEKLSRADGDKSRAAQMLRQSRMQLYSRLRRVGLPGSYDASEHHCVETAHRLCAHTQPVTALASVRPKCLIRRRCRVWRGPCPKQVSQCDGRAIGKEEGQ